MTRAMFCLLVVCAALAQAQAPQEVHTIELDGRLVAYTINDGFAVTQGDIILGPADELENFRQAQVRGPGAARPRSDYFPGTANVRIWPDATMYYTIESDDPVPQNLQAAIDYWNNVAPFKILPRTSERN